MKDWVVPLRLTRDTEVRIAAKTAKEAEELVESGDWDEEVMRDAFIVDWERTGAATPLQAAERKRG